VKIYLTYRERVAGIFMLLAIGLVVAFIVGAAIQNKWFETRVTFHTHVVRGEGLRSGSPVLLSGVEVGEIGDLEILDDNRIDVELVILEQHAHRIQQGSKATIRRLLGIGEKRIHLVSPSEKKPKLPAGALIPADEPMDLLDAVSTVDLGKYIATMDRAVSSMETLFDKLEEDNRMERMVEAFDKVGPTMEKVDYLLGEINEPLAETIKDPAFKGTFDGASKLFNAPSTRKMTRNMSKSFDPEKVTAMIDQLNDSAAALERLMEEDGDLVGAMQGANRLMNDGRMDRMITSMERLTDEQKLEKLIDDMSSLANEMAKVGPEIPEMSHELVNTMRELSIVLKALQKTWLLDDESAEVRKAMKKKARKAEGGEVESAPAEND